MYIEAVPNRDSPPAILLRESYREAGKVKKRTLLNLSDWPHERIAGFKALLKGGTVIPKDQDAITIIRSLPHGHVDAALGTARKIGLDRLLGPDGNRCRDLILALVVSRILDPGSKLAAARALSPDTATSSLGEQLGLGLVGENELYSALDWLAVRQPASRRPSPNDISAAAHWCSTTCRRATWKAVAVRSPNSVTAVTANAANGKSSMGCSAPATAVRWQSRSSRAAPQTRRP
jgi:hypothetical protein